MPCSVVREQGPGAHVGFASMARQCASRTTVRTQGSCLVLTMESATVRKFGEAGSMVHEPLDLFALAHGRAYMRVRVRVRVHVYAFVYIQTHTHTHTHTHICIYIYIYIYI
jgi:hypothetical protein